MTHRESLPVGQSDVVVGQKVVELLYKTKVVSPKPQAGPQLFSSLSFTKGVFDMPFF